MRKQIGLKLPQFLINAIDFVCDKQEKTRTLFIEEAIREKLNKLKININYHNKNTTKIYNSIDEMYVDCEYE